MIFRTLCFLLLTQTVVFAQSPGIIHYQGIIREINGVEITDSLISMRFSIIDSSNEAIVLWQELKNLPIDATGVFSTSLGSENSLETLLENTSDNLLLKIEVLRNQAYEEIGSSPFLYVPYSHHANLTTKSADGIKYISSSGDSLVLEDGRHIIIPGISNLNVGGLTTSNSTEHSCGYSTIHNASKTYGSVEDIDGNTYKTIRIEKLIWMAENLRTEHFSNGDPIPMGIIDQQGVPNPLPGMAYYDNNPSYACPYGAFYNWYAVSDERKLCPSGWRVPTRYDWTYITNIAGGEYAASYNLLSAGLNLNGSPLWEISNSDVPPPNNYFGFSILPAGQFIGAYSDPLGWYTSFWSSTILNNGSAYGSTFSQGSAYANWQIDFDFGASVRCVKENN
jgi:uncharacterized protein (TIGR02145 family)